MGHSEALELARKLQREGKQALAYEVELMAHCHTTEQDWVAFGRLYPELGLGLEA